MQQVIQKSLRTTILQQLHKLNTTNIEFYALLRKLNTTQYNINQTFNEKLENMKNDIKSKIKQLAANVDLMYQVIDRKIGVILKGIAGNGIGGVSGAVGGNGDDGEKLRIMEGRVRELEQQLSEAGQKQNAILAQNQYLKNKNISLIEQIQALSKKKPQTITNDSSSRNVNYKTDLIEDCQTSLQNYVSPIQPPLKQNHQGNDLTFNKNHKVNTKKIKSQQNSFSSLLIKEQNSFQPSYGSDRKDMNRFGFGCMPLRSNYDPIGDVKFQLNKIKEKESAVLPDADGDQSHRLSFLINNLKESEQESSFSSGSSKYHFSRQDSANKSVLSKGVVKKYHI